MSDNYDTTFEKLKRARYAFVRGADYDAYRSICMFAGTINLDVDVSKVRAVIEDYCMGLAKRIIEKQESAK